MPTTTTPVRTPVRQPDQAPWPERYTSPDEICPSQRRTTISPDIEP